MDEPYLTGVFISQTIIVGDIASDILKHPVGLLNLFSTRVYSNHMIKVPCQTKRKLSGTTTDINRDTVL